MASQKKDFKAVIDRGKALRNDGLFMVVDDTFISASTGKNSKETAGAHVVEWLSYDMMSIGKLFGVLVDGKKANSIISGSKFEANILSDTECILTSSKGEYHKIANSKVEEDLATLNLRYILPYQMGQVIRTIEIDPTPLIKQKFTLDLSEEFGVKLLQVTNTMIKNLGKETTKIEVSVATSDKLEQDGMKILRIMTQDSISKTYSYYAFLD